MTLHNHFDRTSVIAARFLLSWLRLPPLFQFKFKGRPPISPTQSGRQCHRLARDVGVGRRLSVTNQVGLTPPPFR